MTWTLAQRAQGPSYTAQCGTDAEAKAFDWASAEKLKNKFAFHVGKTSRGPCACASARLALSLDSSNRHFCIAIRPGMRICPTPVTPMHTPPSTPPLPSRAASVRRNSAHARMQIRIHRAC